MIHQIAPARIGQTLRQLRLDRRRSLYQAAFRLRCKPGTIRRIEEGCMDVSLQKIVDLFEYYGCVVKLEVYEPPVIESLGDMIGALDELGYQIVTQE